MRRAFSLVAALSLLALSACAPRQMQRDPYAALSGTYQGSASLGPIPAPYRLLLSVNSLAGRADAVITRLSNGNVYAATGTFKPYDAQGGTLDLTLYSGKRQAGTFSAQVRGNKLEGVLKTTLFSFDVKMNKVEAAPAPVPTPGEVSTTTTTTTPVFVVPTPGPLPAPAPK